MKIYIFIISFLFSIIITTNQSAKELLVYADSINYDAKKSIIAKGNVKLISGDEILTSNLIIINEKVIGGYSQLFSLNQSGELDKLLRVKD